MTTTRTPTTVATSASMTADPTGHWANRVDRVDCADWATITSELDIYGGALTGLLLTPDDAAEIAALSTDDSASGPPST
jgi:hypothetical protein